MANDPDDAPELTEEWFARASQYCGDKHISGPRQAAIEPDGPIAFYFGYTRIEVIGPGGRLYTLVATGKTTGIEIHQQDQGRTLKVFIGGEQK